MRNTAAGVSSGAGETVRLDYLDGWRGLAIAFVLCAHFLPATKRFDSGRFGVDVFFVLSGLLMSNILFRRRVPLRTFYKRRISRILPVFVLFVVVVFAANWFATGTFRTIEFVATLTFLRTYIPATPGIWATRLPIPHLWSLNVEEHCYVFLGLVTLPRMLRLREHLPLMAAGLLSCAIGIAYVEWPRFAPHSGLLGSEVAASHLLFSAGYYLIRDKFSRVTRPWMPIVAFVASLLCHTTLLPWWTGILISPILLAFSVNHLADTAPTVRRALALAPLRQLGIWSFSIYIWQQPFYLFKRALPPGAAFAGALLTGAVSFQLFENPIRSWLNRNW